MLRKQTKKILVVMLFALTLVLAGRVDANAQTAAPAGVKQVKAQCHLDKDYTKNSVYRNMYPVLFL